MEKYWLIFRRAKPLLMYSYILFGAIIALLVFIPLYPKIPLSNVTGTFIAVRLEDILISIVYIAWGVYLLISKQARTFLKDNLNLTLILFFGVGLVSLISAVFLTRTVSLSLGLLHSLRRVEYMMLMPLAISVVQSRKQIQVALFTLLLVAIVVCLYGIGQQYFHFPVISTGNSEFSKGTILYLTPGARLNSTFAGHYDLAVFLVMVITMLAAVFFTLRSNLFRILVSIGGVLSAFVLVLTAARQSFLAVLVGVVASLILTRHEKLLIGVTLLVILVLIYPSQLRDRFVATFTINIAQEGERYNNANTDQQQRNQLNIYTLPSKISTGSAIDSSGSADKVASDIAPGEPIDSTDLGVFRSFQIRLNVEWPRAIRALIKNPLLGTGYSSLGVATDNDFIRSFGEVGVLGTIALGLVLMVVIKKIYHNFRKGDRLIKSVSAGILAIILAFLLNALFIDVFEASKVASLFWLILGIGLASEKLNG